MSKTIVFTENAPPPIGPYSQAVKTGSTLYVSGQLPISGNSDQLISSDIAKQTTQVMQNILAILNEANMDFSNVVKCSIFVTDIGDFASVNATYQQFFHLDPPARETVEVSALPKGANVEISCIAVDA